MKRPPRRSVQPALTDARHILCINMAREGGLSSGADNNPDAEVFMSLHSRPHCQHANALREEHTDPLTTMVLKLGGKRLRPNTKCSS